MPVEQHLNKHKKLFLIQVVTASLYQSKDYSVNHATLALCMLQLSGLVNRQGSYIFYFKYPFC